MATTATIPKKRALQKRRIIERPRLLALLDGSKTRIKTLVAPAGYGKTTLAEQWVGKEGRRASWFTARRSSTDVAALALGIARACTNVVSDCDARLREHLRALPAPAENVDVLAEILGEDLESWPDEAWLVVDDYQELAAGEDAERFMAELVAASPVQLLIASRQRPSWITARHVLYGEILELAQSALAMDSIEATEVLSGRDAPSASGIVALANGWPAVIGLAGVAATEITDPKAVPESLYEFFAEEVFGALGDDVQRGLATLALAPVLDRALAAKLLGPDRAGVICAAALDVGILVERAPHLDLHPLARLFLDERREQLGFGRATESVDACLAHYRELKDWDAAFEVITRNSRTDQLESLLLEALDELLETARLATIENWCSVAERAGLTTPPFALARAEVALRGGRLAEAQTLAQSAAAGAPALESRALAVAGLAAHLASREEDALELYRRAERAAQTEAEERDARHGQLLCLTELGRPEAVEALEKLTVSIEFSNARDAVRTAALRVHARARLGVIDLAEADLASELLPNVGDPLVESGFLSAYAVNLAVTTRYREGREAAMSLLSLAQRYRLDFAMPYALTSAATCAAGLRDWATAKAYLDEATEASHSRRNAHAEQASLAVRLRTLAQEGRFDTALALDLPLDRVSVGSIHAELVSSRALVLAAAEQVDAAMATLEEVRGSTEAAEPVVLIAAVEAIASLKRRESSAVERVMALEETAFRSGALDPLVTAYRSTPELLAILLRSRSGGSRLAGLLRRLGDEDLASAVGRALPSEADPYLALTAREREVYELLLQGLTNRQIGELLYIGESTVKVHVHHIYDKLGIRSRRALAARAALARPNQATSAIDETAAGDDS